VVAAKILAEFLSKVEIGIGVFLTNHLIRIALYHIAESGVLD
jgi:hypothetical protein